MTAAEAVAGAGVAVAVVTLALVAALAIATRAREPAEAAATMDLGPEVPAVVDLLTDDFELTTDAVPATLVDLGARRWLHIEQYGDANVLIRLPASDPRGDELRPFERQVLDHVRELAVEDVVPAQAMTTGPEAASHRWWKRFRAAVVTDAQAAGLCRPRWRGVSVAFVGIGAVAALGAGWLASNLAEDTTDELRRVDVLTMLTIAGGVVLAAVAGAIGRSDRQRETPNGLEAAGRWLGFRRYLADHGNFDALDAAAVALWDRYLAHAVALGLAPIVAAQLPLGAEDDRHAWSRVTGQWRRVVVSYPRSLLGRGRHPLAVVGVSIVVGAAALGALWVLTELPPFTALGARAAVSTVAVGAAAVLVAAVVASLRAVADLFSSETSEGLVVRARVRATGDRLRGRRPTNDQQRRRYFLAIDDGTHTEVRAWRVSPAIFASVTQGSRVRAVVTPRLRYVRSIETIPEDATARGSAG